MGEISFDVGLAAKLKQAVARNGITNLADIDWLCEGDNIANVRRLRLGHLRLVVPEHVIDCDADPSNPFAKDGGIVEEHQKGGQWKFDPKQVELFSSSGQDGHKSINGNELRKELAGKPVLNANVLDYLLENPHLIPDEWKNDRWDSIRYVAFWGTVYRNRDGSRCVRYLFWFNRRWHRGGLWLDSFWNGCYTAAVRAS